MSCRSSGLRMFCSVFLLGIAIQRTEAVLQDDGAGDVVFVNILYRHGDKNPGSFYPKDPYRDALYWPQGIGQLTARGKQQQYELGQWLRRRYNPLLKEQYSADTIYIQSTDVDRALMSAEINLAGMFPPRGWQLWNESLVWQPIPVHTTPTVMDKLLLWMAPCPAKSEEFHRYFTSDDKIRQLNETYSEFFRWTSENSGKTYDLSNIGFLYDSLLTESMHNFTLPNWTKSVFPEPMHEASLFTYLQKSWTSKLTRLGPGLLLKDMITHMIDKVENKTTRNAYVYSAHDITIANVLNTLGAFNDIIPPLASCLMMELRVNASGNHHVTLYYRNSTTAEPYLLKVSGCDPVCPLDQFISLFKPIMPEDWEQECQATSGNQNSENSFFTPFVLVVIAVVIVLLIVSSLIYYFRRKTNSVVAV